jgi:multiple antibiotic resistance protein
MHMMALLTFLGLSFSALLPLINPLGDALVFPGIVGPATPDVYRRLARRVAINTTLFLILVEAGGAAIIKFFGISLPIMQVSGGLVLAAMGWNLLSQDEAAPAATGNGVVADRRSRRFASRGTVG